MLDGMIPTKNRTIKSLMVPLFELGLTNYDAKVYLALLGEGTSTAKNISDITSIPYGKVYEVINSLVKKGFVIIIPSKPMKCYAISPKEAIITAKKDIWNRIKNVEEIVDNELEPLYVESKRFENPEGTVRIIKGRKSIIVKIDELIKNAVKSIHIQCSSNTLSRLILHKENLKSANERGVRIIIASTITNGIIEEAKGLNFCDIKRIKKSSSSCCFMSFDKEKALIIDPVPDNTDIVYGRDKGLYINSKTYINLFEDLFMFRIKNKRNIYEDVKK